MTARRLLLSVQLAVAPPLLWWSLFPRLGPLEWAGAILVMGMLSMGMAPLLVAWNLWLLVRTRRARPARRIHGPTVVVTLLCLAVALLSWTRTAITPIHAQLAEARGVVARMHHCTPVKVEWYERGAAVDCERPGEHLWVFASNGPFPWSSWKTEIAEIRPVWQTAGHARPFLPAGSTRSMKR
jgi:hypothetical protein